MVFKSQDLCLEHSETRLLFIKNPLRPLFSSDEDRKEKVSSTVTFSRTVT